jgi:ABC-2 type transport system ATP-binding protein
MTAIEISSVTKRYGRTLAVDDLSFSVGYGLVTGFVGPNGAGKSTTMRLVLGLDAPDAGVIRVAGRRYAELRSPLRELGALLDSGATHPGRRARDHLVWLARSNGLPVGRVDDVLRLVGLQDVARRRAGGFSLGMAQRLGIASALLGDPPILLFDEPINGLDPEGIRWIRSFLRELAGEGRAVLVSSHLMSELEGTADRLVVIGRGRLLAETSVDDLLASLSDERVDLRTPQASELMTVLAAAGATVSSSGRDTLTVTGLGVERIAEVALERGLRIHELSPHRTSLEEAFMQLTHDTTEFAADRSEGATR